LRTCIARERASEPRERSAPAKRRARERVGESEGRQPLGKTKGMSMARGSRGLSVEQLREMAKQGAEEALRRLRAEVVAIERTFPELALPQRRRAARQAINSAGRQARTMSAAARKAVSARMKKYWAERRKAQAKVK
jgi:hypothetical protein